MTIFPCTPTPPQPIRTIVADHSSRPGVGAKRVAAAHLPCRSMVFAIPKAANGPRSTDHSEYRYRCTVLAMETLQHSDALARFGHALADATRTRILLSLNRAPGFPSDLADQIGVSRPRRAVPPPNGNQVVGLKVAPSI